MAAITLGSAGVNGLTNYLDRNIDARMRRTNCRPLPAKAIDPPEKALVFCLALTALALGLAFGLGGRDTAGQIVQGWYNRGRAARPKIERAAENVERRTEQRNMPRTSGSGAADA